MNRLFQRLLLSVGVLLVSLARYGEAQDVSLQGGEATSDVQSSSAYGQMLPNMSTAADVMLHEIGNTGFLRNFARVPIRRAIRVGPHFNAPSCVSCHVGNGRGMGRLSSRARFSDVVVKVSRPGSKQQLPGGPGGVPGIGTQLRDHSVAGVKPDARLSLKWTTSVGRYADGSPYELRSPRLIVVGAKHKLPADTAFSVRRAPAIFGSGLLEAIPDRDIFSRADPEDADRDGISGRPNIVWNVENRSFALGKFGFKAGAPTLKQQVAAAYANDMGVTNPLFKGRGGSVDIPARILNTTSFYVATLAVPRARAQSEPLVIRGKAWFSTFGCMKCHATNLRTGNAAPEALSNNLIHPFTDLLLHDMGEALADGRPEFEASGREWRTSPLWGIGLADLVLSKPATYLHDGRAQSLEEAILWHGGEGAPARDAFIAASKAERDALVVFLRSL